MNRADKRACNLYLIGVLVFLGIVALFCANSYGATDVPLTFATDDPCDKIVIKRYSSGVFIDSVISLAADSADADSNYYSITLSLDETKAVSLNIDYYWTGGNPTSEIIVWGPTSGNVGVGGVYTLDYYVLDAADSSAINDALVTFRNWALTTNLYTERSDENGIARQVTNYDSMAALVTAYGYTFSTAWDSMEWTTDTSDTIFGTAVASPAAPNNPAYCYVYGNIRASSVNDTGDIYVEGVTVTAGLNVNTGLTDTTGGAVIISHIAGSAVSDSTGLFYMYLRRSKHCLGSQLDSTTARYTITGTNSDGVDIFNAPNIWVPDTGNFNLTDSIDVRP